MQAAMKFPPALAATGRSPEIPEAAGAYGWLVGSWDLDVRHYGVDVSALDMKGEVHFGWALEGRAIQDVWIMPRRSERTSELGKTNNMYGTTLRVWDGAIQALTLTAPRSVGSSVRLHPLGAELALEPPGLAIRIQRFTGSPR
jgi:hypothetical protein